MLATLKAAALAALLATASDATGAELGVLAPVFKDKAPHMRAAPNGKGDAPVLTRVTSGKLFDALQREASTGFTARMLQLDDAAARIAGQRADTKWLMLAFEDGGYARHGFWLQDGDHARWMDEPYVDLVVSEDSVEDGSFEEIYAHELGHILLRRVLPKLPDGYSRSPHHSHTITDQPTAFDEGFAIHFQALARAHTANPRLRALDAGIAQPSPWAPLWQSNLDRNARIDGVRRNWFVHAQVPAPGKGDHVMRYDMSLLFDRTRLKNPAQMVASEGAVATFFFRHLAVGSTPDFAPRYEPMLRAMRTMNGEALTAATPLIPTLAATLTRTAPDEGRRFIQDLLETSLGALASPALARQSEEAAEFGRKGEMNMFLLAMKGARSSMAGALAEVQADPSLLAKAVGQPVWVLHKSMAVDLNTAEVAHLAELMHPTLAWHVLEERRKNGLFRSVGDVITRSKVPSGVARSLRQMAVAMQKAGTYSRK